MPLPTLSDLCKRLRCFIACCGGTVVIRDDAAPPTTSVDQEKESADG